MFIAVHSYKPDRNKRSNAFVLGENRTHSLSFILSSASRVFHPLQQKEDLLPKRETFKENELNNLLITNVCLSHNRLNMRSIFI